MTSRPLLVPLLAGASLWLSTGACDDSKPKWTEDSPALCSDGFDNDGDGLADCADTDCSYRFPGLCQGGVTDTGAADTHPADVGGAPKDTTPDPDPGPPAPVSPVCQPSTQPDCSDCPEGWQRCVEFTAATPPRTVCSRECNSDADCGEYGLCYAFDFGNRCMNYDAAALGFYCPSGWSWSQDFSHCPTVGTSWVADGIPAEILSYDDGSVDRLTVTFGADYPDLLMIVDSRLYAGEPIPIGAYNLRAGENGNWATCTHCVRLGDGCDADGCARVFFQAWGKGQFTELSTSSAGLYSGALNDLVLVEVSFDPDDYWSTPVPGGACYRFQRIGWGSSPLTGGTSAATPPEEPSTNQGLSAAGGTAHGTCTTVTFSYPAGTGSHSVLLSGSFNDWATTAGDGAEVLTDPDGDGVWTVEVALWAAAHEYKFIVDGQWIADPSHSNRTPDGQGGLNSVITVTCP